MSSDEIIDLRQFIAATLGQFSEQLSGQLAQQNAQFVAQIHRLNQKIDKIDDKTDEILLAIADTFHVSVQATDERLDNHNRRISRLEHKSA